MCFLGRSVSLLCATALFIFCLAPAYANGGDPQAQAIAKQNACLGCHAVTKKIVGPSFQEVAKKYANNPSATAFLKTKIQKGGSGSWGLVPMPANAKLNDTDLSILVSWILRGAPTSN